MIDVLVVDDSMMLRKLLERLLTEDGGIRVAGGVASGEEALRFVASHPVDVVTMDIEMGGMDGFETTRRIMESRPLPVVIVSSCWDPSEVEKTFRAVDAGAVGLLSKPGELHELEDYGQELRRAVREAALAGPPPRRRRRGGPSRGARSQAERGSTVPRLVALGASTGGPQALAELLARLPGHFPLPLLVVQHIAPGFLKGLVEWLDGVTALTVRIAREGERVERGVVHIGPEGSHLELRRGDVLALSQAPPEHAVRPSVSRLFRSVAEVCGAGAAAVLLSGMGKDGAEEMGLLRQGGAATFAQDRESSIVWGMPGEAVRLGAAREVLAPAAIADALVSLVERQKDLSR